jgi:hypothetical protein
MKGGEMIKRDGTWTRMVNVSVKESRHSWRLQPASGAYQLGFHDGGVHGVSAVLLCCGEQLGQEGARRILI